MISRLWQRGESVDVECDERGRPLRFRWRGEWHGVAQVCNRWQAKGKWWRLSEDMARGEREYIKLATEEGLLCLVGRDVGEEGWVLVREYD